MHVWVTPQDNGKGHSSHCVHSSDSGVLYLKCTVHPAVTLSLVSARESEASSQMTGQQIVKSHSSASHLHADICSLSHFIRGTYISLKFKKSTDLVDKDIH